MIFGLECLRRHLYRNIYILPRTLTNSAQQETPDNINALWSLERERERLPLVEVQLRKLFG
jgi:hypothetical protein